jgi:hypothetical protein
MATVTAERVEAAASPWGSCPSSQAAETGREGNGLPCCVHVSDDGEDSTGRQVSLFCCWCGTAVPASIAGLPPRMPSSRRHGPIARGCRPARRTDVAFSRR